VQPESAKTEGARRGRLVPNDYVDGVLRGDRVILARAITVIESEHPHDSDLAQQILESVLPHSGRSYRVGITGVPGAGKSTFIDELGMYLVREKGHKVAVLSVDPSSPLSGGSILGDKTRMERLANEESAFIRPSPARGHLGGVARRTREAILLCEAAGFTDVLVETIGVGQSETAVRSMTDFFLLLMIPGAGDELQGIKRGILEMIDGMAVNKADGDNKAKAERARSEYAGALRLFPRGPDGWSPRVLTCSALSGEGISEIWALIEEHGAHQRTSGYFAIRRQQQALDWTRELISLGLEDAFQKHPSVRARLPAVMDSVMRGEMTSFAAARELLGLLRLKE
jgi:LAO/AO transport system kinase